MSSSPEIPVYRWSKFIERVASGLGGPVIDNARLTIVARCAWLKSIDVVDK